MNKLMYGINKTNAKDNTVSDEQLLITERMNPQIESEIERCVADRNLSIKPFVKPLYATFYSFGIFLVVTVGMLNLVKSGIVASQAAMDAIEVGLYGSIGIVVVSVLVAIMLIVKVVRIVKSPEMKQLETTISDLYSQAIAALDISTSTAKMDIFTMDYVVNNSKRRIKKMTNVDCLVWREPDELKIWNSQYVIAIPIFAITGVQDVKKKIKLYHWNKDIPSNQEPYKKFKIKRRDNNTELYVTHYFMVTIDIDGTTYEMHIPNYEIENFHKLTGMGEQFVVLH